MKRLLSLASMVLPVAVARPALGFSHVVHPGETLASIAEHMYGSSKLEGVLVGANALDVQGGSVIVPGMRLEIPAPAHDRVVHGERWADLALKWLGTGAIARADLLARSNGSVPWVPPVDGEQIEIPAIVTYIAAEGDTVNTIAARFWGDAARGWELNYYNELKGLVARGAIVLVPMRGLRLTDDGRKEAREAAARDGATGSDDLGRQRNADADIPELLGEVRQGRYVDAVALGNRILAVGTLGRIQLAVVDRALVEAYVALDDDRAATAACSAWRVNEPDVVLDPVRLSPKLLKACAQR